MTDGTSQGLFVVVAIVIFGIFVVLAYILFEDTLSPAMANMFSESTEQATLKLDGYRLLDKDVLDPHLSEIGYINFDFNRYHVDDDTKFRTYSKEWEEHAPENNVYKLSYRAYREGRETYMDSLYRVYIQYDFDKKDEFNVVKAYLRINNKKIAATLEEASNEDRNILRYFVAPYDKTITFEKDTLNVVDLYFTTDDKKIMMTPQKTRLFIDGMNEGTISNLFCKVLV